MLQLGRFFEDYSGAQSRRQAVGTIVRVRSRTFSANPGPSHTDQILLSLTNPAKISNDHTTSAIADLALVLGRVMNH